MMFIASLVVRLSVHCEKLDDGDSHYSIRNRDGTRYCRTHPCSWNVVVVVGKEKLRTPTAPFNLTQHRFRIR